MSKKGHQAITFASRQPVHNSTSGFRRFSYSMHVSR